MSPSSIATTTLFARPLGATVTSYTAIRLAPSTASLLSRIAALRVLIIRWGSYGARSPFYTLTARSLAFRYARRDQHTGYRIHLALDIRASRTMRSVRGRARARSHNDNRVLVPTLTNDFTVSPAVRRDVATVARRPARARAGRSSKRPVGYPGGFFFGLALEWR